MIILTGTSRLRHTQSGSVLSIVSGATSNHEPVAEESPWAFCAHSQSSKFSPGANIVRKIMMYLYGRTVRTLSLYAILPLLSNRGNGLRMPGQRHVHAVFIRM